ncbi:Uncharacterized conserved protein YkwD, contains CAP (CSP/antigen 5/PR1) domain [Sinosporangium album]|uniref:Uncharacterized conserved protein YkwD, contains CAP (CSP/antigen 5/PR1) domain n=1 Tax=Sinosporangium album TaxID=504805 RepID=A0A1G8AVD6_9ACTN|nr:CAP domain-containing protein [Sinosporangium album]SDH24814.1 Uncharacterized conserved protein YkwD, contains CAP (CSP/antigen 5/PR1) domain [Sinosporangium album]
MRKSARALAFAGGVVALSAVSNPAEASAAPASACKVVAVNPVVDDNGNVRGSARREGCSTGATLRVRVIADKPGSDKILSSTSRSLTNGAVSSTARCSADAEGYYVVAIETGGRVTESQAVTLTCGTPSTPTATPRPTTTTTATPRPTPSVTPTATQSATPTSTRSTTPTATPPGSPSSTPTAGGASSFENEVVRLTNNARRQAGCGEVKFDARLRAAAYGHSKDMGDNNYFSHTSKNGRGPGDRIKAAGFTPVRAWAENIAMGQRTAAAVVDAWLKSSGHAANIKNCTYTHIGVGYYAHSRAPYWTQVFARQ